MCEEVDAHADGQMLKDKDVQLGSISCQASEVAMSWHGPTHTDFCTTLDVNFTPIRVHVFLSRVFELAATAGVCLCVCVCVCECVSILNLNPYQDKHNVTKALPGIAFVCGHAGCVTVTVDFV